MWATTNVSILRLPATSESLRVRQFFTGFTIVADYAGSLSRLSLAGWLPSKAPCSRHRRGFLGFPLYVRPPPAPRPPSTELFTLLYTISSPLLGIDYSAISFSVSAKDCTLYIPSKQTDSTIQWTSDIYFSFQLQVASSAITQLFPEQAYLLAYLLTIYHDFHTPHLNANYDPTPPPFPPTVPATHLLPLSHPLCYRLLYDRIILRCAQAESMGPHDNQQSLYDSVQLAFPFRLYHRRAVRACYSPYEHVSASTVGKHDLPSLSRIVSS